MADVETGRENVGLVIECGNCGTASFKVSWLAVPVAAADVWTDHAFRPLRPHGSEGGHRLSPRYGFECLNCGVFLLASPDGPEPQLVRSRN